MHRLTIKRKHDSRILVNITSTRRGGNPSARIYSTHFYYDQDGEKLARLDGNTKDFVGNPACNNHDNVVNQRSVFGPEWAGI